MIYNMRIRGNTSGQSPSYITSPVSLTFFYWDSMKYKIISTALALTAFTIPVYFAVVGI